MLVCLVNLKTDKFAYKLAKCPSSLFGRLSWCPVLWPCVYFQSWKFHLCLHLLIMFIYLNLVLMEFLMQVAQVLLTLPYSFSQLGLLYGILFQLFYGLMGSWTAYLISLLYVEYRTRREREKVDFRNHVI
ncbi:unnamed protein product [Prunus brigantina]